MNLTPTFIQSRLAHRPNLLKVLENIGWLVLDKILRLGVGLGISIWLARYLGPEKYGLLNFGLAMATFFSALALLGLRNIVVRDIVQHPEDAGNILGSAIFLQTIGGLIAYGLLIGTIYLLRPDDPHSQLVVAIVGLMLIFKFGEVAKYWFEAQVQSKYAVLAENSMYLLSAAVKISLILAEAPLAGIAGAFALDFALIATGLFLMLAWKGIDFADIGINFRTINNLLKDSWPLIFSALAIMVYMKIDQLMLGQMAGDRAVGIYSAAVKISEAWYFIAIAISTSVFPAIIQAKNISQSQYYSHLQTLHDALVLIALSIAIPMTIMSEFFIDLLYGADYQQSATVLTIHIWAALFVFLGVAGSRWFIAENFQISAMYRTVGGAVLNIILNYYLIPKHGPSGAAIATIFSQALASWLADSLSVKTRPIFRIKTKALMIPYSLIRTAKTLNKKRQK